MHTTKPTRPAPGKKSAPNPPAEKPARGAPRAAGSHLAAAARKHDQPPRSAASIAAASAAIEQTLAEAAGRAGVADITKLPAKAQAAIARGAGYQVIPLDKTLSYSPTNREEFDPEALAEMIESVREHGVIQPIIVRRIATGLEVVVGERRVRASRALKLPTIPAIVRELTDAEALKLQLIENLQREGLRPLDEARGYRRMETELGYSVAQICQAVSVKKTVVYARLALLDLPAETLAAVKAGKLKASLAQELTRADDPGAQRALTQQILHPGQHAEKEGGTLSFRATKLLVDQKVAELEERRAWEKEMSAQSGRLRTVLSFDASKKLLPYSFASIPGYVKLSDCCGEDPQRRTYETLLRKREIQLTICCDPDDGRPVRLVLQKDAAAAIAAAGYDFTAKQGEAPKSEDAEKNKARAKRERAGVNRAIFGAAVKETVTVGARLGWTTALARYLVQQAIGPLTMKRAEWIVQRRGWEEVNAEKWTAGKILRAHAAALNAKECLGLLLEIRLLAFEPYDYGDAPFDPGLGELTAAVKVDAKAIEKKFRASGKA